MAILSPTDPARMSPLRKKSAAEAGEGRLSGTSLVSPVYHDVERSA